MSLVGGRMIWTVFAIGIILRHILRICPLTGGSVILSQAIVPFLHALGVYMSWVVEGITRGSCCIRCAPE